MKTVDVTAIMVDAGTLRRLQGKILAYTRLIALVDDIPTVRTYLHKRTAYERMAEKLRRRLAGVNWMMKVG